jgi:hypothetical protein
MKLTIKLLLIVVGVLLIINLAVIVTGGYWQFTYAKDGYAYKTNRITGTTYLVAGRTQEEVTTKIPVTTDSSSINFAKNIIEDRRNKLADEKK